MRESLARQKIVNAGLRVRVRRQPHPTVETGFVFGQSPPPGEKIERGNSVTLIVSTGKPQATVPAVVGKPVAEAVEQLTAVGLDPNPVNINSSEPPGTVTGQGVKPGVEVDRGTRIRINVSTGPRPIEVPPVVGLPYDEAADRLESLGFQVARTEVQSSEPRDTVVRAIPAPEALAPVGSVVELLVSNAPELFAVPDVTGFERSTAAGTLRGAGFRVEVSQQQTLDPGQDGVVLYQDPAPEAEAEKGESVTIFVGEYVGPATTAEEPVEPVPVESVPTDTTVTDTTATETTPADNLGGGR
jgi:serine/threonine-protein kinase